MSKINTKQLAQVLDLTPRQVERRRNEELRGPIPANVKRGRTVLYEVSEVKSWLEMQKEAAVKKYNEQMRRLEALADIN